MFKLILLYYSRYVPGTEKHYSREDMIERASALGFCCGDMIQKYHTVQYQYDIIVVRVFSSYIIIRYVAMWRLAVKKDFLISLVVILISQCSFFFFDFRC